MSSIFKTRKVNQLLSEKHNCSCGQEFEGDCHRITLDLGENTRATVDFQLLQPDGDFWCFCPTCLKTHFQNHLDSLNPSQLAFMRDMLTKTAVSILKTESSSEITVGKPAEIIIIDENEG